MVRALAGLSTMTRCLPVAFFALDEVLDPDPLELDRPFDFFFDALPVVDFLAIFFQHVLVQRPPFPGTYPISSDQMGRIT